MAEEEAKKSKYNTGLAKIYRLDGLWKSVNIFSTSGKYSKWNEFLDRIWCELCNDLKENTEDEKDFKKNKEKIENLDGEIGRIGNFEDNATDSFNPVTKNQMDKRNEHYKKLMEKEIFLRRLENILGKGTAWEDEDEDEFG